MRSLPKVRPRGRALGVRGAIMRSINTFVSSDSRRAPAGSAVAPWVAFSEAAPADGAGR